MIEDEFAMRRMRYFFTTLGVSMALALVVLPLLVAMNLVESPSINTWLLFSIAVISGIQAVLQPALKAVQRRSDWINAMLLRSQFERELYLAKTDDARNEVVQKFTLQQAQLWRERSDTLTEATLRPQEAQKQKSDDSDAGKKE